MRAPPKWAAPSTSSAIASYPLADFITGGEGDDRVEGRAGNDFEHGDEGNDHLGGGRGSDDHDGGEVKDRCKDSKSGPPIGTFVSC
jgi:hypothetical protein